MHSIFTCSWNNIQCVVGGVQEHAGRVTNKQFTSMTHIQWNKLWPALSPQWVFGCARLWCWVSLCTHFTIFYTEDYFIMTVATIYLGNFLSIIFWTTYLVLPKLGSSASATTHIPGCFCPWTSYLNIGLNMLSSDSLMSYSDSLIGYSTPEFQALQLIVLWVFSTVYLATFLFLC